MLLSINAFLIIVEIHLPSVTFISFAINGRRNGAKNREQFLASKLELKFLISSSRIKFLTVDPVFSIWDSVIKKRQT